MKKRILTIIMTAVLMLFANSTLAYLYIADPHSPGGELNLYQIYNDLFGGVDYTSSDSLFMDRGLADSSDNWWNVINGEVTVTVRYAGYDQELGVQDIAGYVPLVTGIPGGSQTVSISPFNTNGSFVFVEKLDGAGTGVGPWYSDDQNSPSVDHFMAFNVSDLVTSSTGSAWMIAFEDLANGGDRDYNDLVAVVTDVRPIPEPTNMLLLGTGLIGLAVIGRRKLFKK